MKYNQYVYELMNNDHVVDDDRPTFIEQKVQETINLDISHLIRTLVDLRDDLEAAGYTMQGTLDIGGPLNVTIQL